MKKNHTQSAALFERAKEVIPGGVNSPVRAFRGVGGTPLFITSAKGAMLTDADGNTYIDYVGSWGPMILGHAREEVIAAIQQAAARGTSYGAPTELEIQLAEEVMQAVPSIEKLRLTSSGTEATMSALRVARGFTGRPKIVKFEGCYHGHGDSLLVRAGSGVATLGLPDSPGVLAEVAANTITVPFNDAAALEQVFNEVGEQIAAVIIEPVVGNMGCVPPGEGYLQAVRTVTEKHGAVLIFDEVMTGFRVAFGGAQQLYGIKPDMTCLGKIIGGGLPVGAFGGRREIMDVVAPVGPVYQAGTLSGNPLAVTAGLTTLRLLKSLNPYPQLDAATARLVEGLSAAAAEAGIQTVSNRVGSMFTGFFTAEAVTDWTSAGRSDRAAFGRFFHAMLDEGVYLAPSQFEAGFVSIEHTGEIIERTIEAARQAFKAASGAEQAAE
ncbi:MAG TPA: glutamate-1-semialdehyde 2,1-aminomutase [Blastocatellia bacterium]|nr:glutamate-1-semialdehyde 2,1-aminomutase [Blastocatellia bacterium]HMX26252.1 glutamate-1-semialdehyde 2,1-aminomutase [Blastocatellia bacterium]HMZ21128.1 glutamate-1-semialdehyde 2,1-aminomutase [Blastocatellia bacterium]HNG28940.1 glutamate-1-semialdehyde 2,1-aminomutase [Blastocatellia bacterium]